MLIALVLASGGMLAGLLLLRRAPLIPSGSGVAELPKITVIIPARNEERNLPILLRSLCNGAEHPYEILVVDDHSIDSTAAVALQFGATVLQSAPLPLGWTGKTWACQQGSMAATGDIFCFLDADTFFVDRGYGRMARFFADLGPETALSILPYHLTKSWYEELSLFFNIVLAMGAGGFGGFDPPHLFGQNLVVSRALYVAAGGHETVRSKILENLHLTAAVRDAGGRILTAGGRGTLCMRMFPDGFEQLCSSWRKAFADGARASSPLALGVSIYWLSSLLLIAVMVPFRGDRWIWPAVAYSCAALQVGCYARQLGRFSWIAAALYPITLAFYFAIFSQSAWRRTRGHATVWRGRRV